MMFIFIIKHSHNDLCIPNIIQRILVRVFMKHLLNPLLDGAHCDFVICQIRRTLR